MIKLEAYAKTRHACITVQFATEDAALAFMDRTQYGTGATLYVTGEDHEHPVPQECTRLLDRLYPTCEHGLSAQLCYGPQHYPMDHQL